MPSTGRHKGDRSPGAEPETRLGSTIALSGAKLPGLHSAISQTMPMSALPPDIAATDAGSLSGHSASRSRVQSASRSGVQRAILMAAVQHAGRLTARPPSDVSL